MFCLVRAPDGSVSSLGTFDSSTVADMIENDMYIVGSVPSKVRKVTKHVPGMFWMKEEVYTIEEYAISSVTNFPYFKSTLVKMKCGMNSDWSLFDSLTTSEILAALIPFRPCWNKEIREYVEKAVKEESVPPIFVQAVLGKPMDSDHYYSTFFTMLQTGTEAPPGILIPDDLRTAFAYLKCNKPGCVVFV